MGIFTKHRVLVAFICTFLMIGVTDQARGQGSEDNRTLTGSADLGDVGRYVGPLKLGELTVSSDQVAPGGTQHSINIAADGFAWLGNGLMIRNGSGQDLVFDGTNPNSQSHDLDVYFFGTVGGPTFNQTNERNRSLGSFDIQQHALSGTNQYQTDGDVTTTFGGYWYQRGVYRDDNGANETINVLPSGRGTNPINLQHESSFANNGNYNRTHSAQPAALAEDIRGLFSAPLRKIDAESVPAERRNTLFAVQPAAAADAGTLDLSGIDITVSGTSIVDRHLSGSINLGRAMIGGPDQVVSRTDNLQVRTFGNDDNYTRLQLQAFNTAPAADVHASLAGNVDFDSGDDTASVTLTGDFTIDGNQIGSYFKSVDVGASIVALESAIGQTTQSTLGLGYRYAVVGENEAESDSVTVYKIDDFDTSGEIGRNYQVRQVHDIDTHTDISIVDRFTLDGNNLQTVNLSVGNGISGEGLAGEQVTATTSYNIHTKSIQSSDLEFTAQGNVGESVIEIENARVASGGQLQATAFLNGASRDGSDRWYLDRQGNANLGAGESMTLTPTFDEVGLVEEGLGRNYRTTFELTFQDGRFGSAEDAVAGTFNAGRNFGTQNDRFDIYGSEETEQTLRWVVEKNVAVEDVSGTISLAAGTSLRDEGINLTNTSDNSTAGFVPTTVTILDGVIATEDETTADVSLSFEKLADASENQSGAEGFDSLNSDIVELTGLDGMLHAIQMSYNFDSEEAGVANASLLWFDDEDPNVLDDGGWVNAVLGNSNVTEYDLLADTILLDGNTEAVVLSEYLTELQFSSSYTDYLFSTETGAPELGAHGYDVEAGVVWAVIDHNSSFGATAVAVPEPGTFAVLSACFVGMAGRRRRA